MRLPPARFALSRAVVDALTAPGSGTSPLGGTTSAAQAAPVGVGCSGGPDSLALVQACADAGIAAIAVVVDHGLQRGSEQVAGLAARRCRELGVQTQIATARVTVTGAGPEADARSARYREFERFCDERGIAALMLAHTRDDQAETVLLRLARGSGARSLAGIPARRGRYVRPFLGIDRATVAEALAEGGLTAWDDPHNHDPRFARVRVRERVLPLLAEQLGPGVRRGLLRTAELASADADALDSLAADLAVRWRAADRSAAELLPHPAALRWRVLRAWLLECGCPASDLTLEHVRGVDALLTQWHGQGPLALPGRINIVRRYGTLVAETRSPDQGSRPDGPQ